jgi:Tol biopolymer transport system component
MGGRVSRLARGLAIDAPAWSPDGRYIAFAALRGADDTAPPWLYVVRANGSGLRRLIPLADADDIGGDETGAFRPSWSPDSKFIATVGNGDESVIVVDLRGRIRWRIDRPRALVFAVSWSPDGRRIAFDDDGTIHVVNRDGKNLRPLGSGRGFAWLHGWGPDSRRLAVTRPGVVSILDVRSGQERKLLTGRFDDVVWGWRKRP